MEPSSEFRSHPILTPREGVNPMEALTSSIHSSPRLDTFLIEGGMLRAVEQPGGWEVLDKTITSYAATQNVDPGASDLKPTDWWDRAVGKPPPYNRVLEPFEPTREGRLHRPSTCFEGVKHSLTRPRPGTTLYLGQGTGHTHDKL